MKESQSAMILLVGISVQLSKMPTLFAIAAIRVCLVKAVQPPQLNSIKIVKTVDVSRLKATLIVIPSMVACGNMIKKATTATKKKNLSTC